MMGSAALRIEVAAGAAQRKMVGPHPKERGWCELYWIATEGAYLDVPILWTAYVKSSIDFSDEV